MICDKVKCVCARTRTHTYFLNLQVHAVIGGLLEENVLLH